MTARGWLSKWRHLHRTKSLLFQMQVVTRQSYLHLSSHAWRRKAGSTFADSFGFPLFFIVLRCNGVWQYHEVFFVLMNKFRLRCVRLGLGLFVIGAMLYRVCIKRAKVNHKWCASTALQSKVCLLLVKTPPNKKHMVNFFLISPFSVYGNKWVKSNDTSTRKHPILQVKHHFEAIFGWETIKKNLDLWYQISLCMAVIHRC